MPKLIAPTPQTTSALGLTAFGNLVLPPALWSAPGGEESLYLGHVVDRLREMPAGVFQTCCTSPPYWNLRDYGTAKWGGGDPACDHQAPFQPRSERPNTTASDPGRGGDYADEQAKGSVAYRKLCGKCGAKRIDQQLGSEDVHDCFGWATHNPCGECFTCHMVEVFSEVRRVLRDDGTLWLNLGDTFDEGQMLVPTSVAMALRADGWRLVQDIIWYAPNKMPESVTNRCSKSHEHIFLLAKGKDWYFDHEAIKVGAKSKYKSSDFIPNSDKDKQATAATAASANGRDDEVMDRDVNKRDVWVVPVASFKGAHFATFSPRLIEPCILAGTSEYGCCAECGKPYERVVVKSGAVVVGNEGKYDRSIASNRNGLPGSNSTLSGVPATTTTAGWRQGCEHVGAGVVPCLVLDPFAGSGTTPATAVSLGRRGVGIDLSERYLREFAVPRCEAAISGDRAARKSPEVVLRPAVDDYEPEVIQ